LLEFIYVVYLLGKYFPGSCLTELLCDGKKNEILVKNNLKFLYQSNMINLVENPEPDFDIQETKFKDILGERLNYIKEIVVKRLYGWVINRNFDPCYNILEHLHDLGSSLQDSLLLEAITNDIHNGTYLSIENAIENGSFNKVTGKHRAPPLSYCFVMLKNFLYGSAESIKEAYQELKQQDSDIPVYMSEILSIETRYRTALRDTSAALEAAKKSFVIIQGTNEKREMSHVYRLFALANMTGKEIDDAIDYLAFAMDIAEKNKDYSEMTVSAYYSAAVHFVFGNLSKAKRLLNLSIESALNSARINWANRAKFFLGRCHFETGHYKEAFSVFENLMKDEELGAMEKKTVGAWIFRTEFYLNLVNNRANYPSRKITDCTDGRLFEIEALCLSGKCSKSIELANTFIELINDNDFLFLEQPDWTSGFAQCELIGYSSKDFFTRMCTALISLVALRKKNVKAAKEALNLMQKIMRNERSTDCDPNSAFYYFANYLTLNELNSSEVDKNSAISMAFKKLQIRASKIDDVETRRSFMYNHFWNKFLYKTAKDYKLI